MMRLKKYIGMLLLLLAATSALAQKAERDYIRKGNRAYKDSVYVDAEVNYRKALEANPKSTVSMFNLGNTLLQQNKVQEAMEQYAGAARVEKDKMNLAQIYHNMGVILQSQKQFGPAIECYKNALRRNPQDDESRYNLVLCQHQLKNNPQQEQQNGGNENKDGKDQNKEEDKNSQKQDKPQSKDDTEEQKQQKQQQQHSDEMSKETAEQLLNAAMQEEKQTQERIKKAAAQPQRRRLEKQW